MTATTIPDPPGTAGLTAPQRAAGTARAWQLGTRLADALGPVRPTCIATRVYRSPRVAGQVAVHAWLSNPDDLLRVAIRTGAPINTASSERVMGYLDLGEPHARITVYYLSEVTA